jgi:uncharacterized membrane protein
VGKFDLLNKFVVGGLVGAIIFVRNHAGALPLANQKGKGR